MFLSLDPVLLFGAVPLSFFDLLGSAGLGAALAAVLAEALGRARKKVFLDKFAQQMAAMGLAALAAGLAGGLARAGLLALKRPWAAAPYLTPDPTMLALFGLLAGSAALLAAYRLSWKKMKNSKGAHLVLGAATAALALAAALVSARAAALLLPATTAARLAEAPGALPEAVVPALGLLAPLTGLGAAWTLCAAGALGLLFLLHRRERDDYGRDYYHFALRLAARWAVGGMAASLVLAGWTLAALAPESRSALLGPLLPATAALAALALAAAAAWGAAAASRNPLQLKWLMGLGAVAAWTAHALFLALTFHLHLG